MRQKRLLPLTLCAPLLLGACGGHEQHVNSPEAAGNPTATARPQTSPRQQQQEVTATVEEATLQAGGSGEATITLDIKEGYHVNANPPSDKFYIGTQLDVTPAEGLKPGAPVYPSPVSRKFAFAEKPLNVYEREAVIKLPLQADASAAKGRHTLAARVRVQPCNDQACLQPRTLETSVNVTVE